jgi:uncharacterized 2Fe-2S/4Fe-4S cluster protein (DUF4445 family)
MVQHNLKIMGIGKKPLQQLKANQGKILSEVLTEAGFNLKFYCQGRGICGQCFVEVIKGQLPAETPKEKELRKDKKLPANYRLACQLRITHPLVIRIPENLFLDSEKEIKFKSGEQPEIGLFAFNPTVKKYIFKLRPRTSGGVESLAEELKSSLSLSRLKYSLSALKKIAHSASRPGEKNTVVVHADEQVVDVEGGDTTGEIYGLAVDLGTTTVVAQLLDLNSGKIISQASTLNRQAAYGSDIISRIALAGESPDYLERLKLSALRSIEEVLFFLVKDSKVKGEKIYAVCIAGNTVMNHLLLGLPVSSLGHSPFRPVFSVLPVVKARELGLEVNHEAVAYFCPNLRSFIGGDVASGLIATGLADKPGNYLYVDLGTNGEIVLKRGKSFFLATSTAAGPAFEGVGISCGMMAAPGAIEVINWKEGKFVSKTIGGKEPQGICGTGLVGLLAEALKAGLLSPAGKILTPGSEIRLTGAISLKQKDIRKLQLAMGAIKAGMKLLLSSVRLKLGKIDKLFIAGAFGNSLDLEQCLNLGLLPPLPREKIVFVGNASLAGARNILLDLQAKDKIETLPRRVKFLSLADKKEFEQEFLKALEIGQSYWRDLNV